MSVTVPRGVAGWLVLVGAALALNAVWELAQRPLYDDPGSVLHCLRAALTDAAWTLGAGGVALLAVRTWGRHAFVPALVVLLALAAVGIEAWALATERWSYAAAMPTLVGLGVAPLLQLPLLGALATLATRWVPARAT